MLFGVLDRTPSERPAAAPAVHRDLDVLLLARASTLRSHPGEVAFPGGRVDPGDPDTVSAALREAREETGLDPSGVEVLGTLPAVPLAHSNHLVRPVLGWWREPTPVRVVDERESAAVFRTPVADLLDPANRGVTVLRRGGQEWRGRRSRYGRTRATTRSGGSRRCSSTRSSTGSAGRSRGTRRGSCPSPLAEGPDPALHPARPGALARLRRPRRGRRRRPVPRGAAGPDAPADPRARGAGAPRRARAHPVPGGLRLGRRRVLGGPAVPRADRGRVDRERAPVRPGRVPGRTPLRSTGADDRRRHRPVRPDRGGAGVRPRHRAGLRHERPGHERHRRGDRRPARRAALASGRVVVARRRTHERLPRPRRSRRSSRAARRAGSPPGDGPRRAPVGPARSADRRGR